MYQHRYIFFSFPKWRQAQSYDIQTVIKIFAKISFFERCLKIAIRRRNNANVDSDGHDTADSLKLPFLKKP